MSLRTAVIGVGHLGRQHARLHATLSEEGHTNFVSVCDQNPETAQTIAEERKVAWTTDWTELIGEVDAVSLAVPTVSHCEIACGLLAQGIHVLVEKPISRTLEEAERMIDAAANGNALLQVGHLERFNAAVLAAEPHITSPRFMECTRLAPYKERGTDVNVVLDLMIHDIDLVQSLANSEIESIDAIGTPVFSGEIDIANARIRFANGCVANTTASRVSLKTERKLRIFEDAAYISLDLQQKILTLIRKRVGEAQPGQLPVNIEEANLEQGDALKSEIESFLDCIRNNQRPLVSGEDGLRALETAIRISEQVHANLGKAR